MGMTTPAAVEPPRTALELIAEAIVRLRATDPADTAAALLAAWHGFGTAEAAGGLLAEDNPDDAVLARNARPIMAGVATRLREAPSLPFTDIVKESVDGLTPPGYQPPDYSEQLDDPNEVADLSPAGSVRRAILGLALELNTLLPRAAEKARNQADREACEHGTRLAYELSRCWEGRLGSFLNNSQDLITPRRTGNRQDLPRGQPRRH